MEKQEAKRKPQFLWETRCHRHQGRNYLLFWFLAHVLMYCPPHQGCDLRAARKDLRANLQRQTLLLAQVGESAKLGGCVCMWGVGGQEGLQSRLCCGHRENGVNSPYASSVVKFLVFEKYRLLVPRLWAIEHLELDTLGVSPDSNFIVCVTLGRSLI